MKYVNLISNLDIFKGIHIVRIVGIRSEWGNSDLLLSLNKFDNLFHFI